MTKFNVIGCPNKKALMIPVKIVAIVLLYFLRMASAYLKKKDERMPCSALLNINNVVTNVKPSNIEEGTKVPVSTANNKPKMLKHNPKKYKKKFCSKTLVSIFFFSANSLYTEANDGMVMDPTVYMMATGENISPFGPLPGMPNWFTEIPATSKYNASHWYTENFLLMIAFNNRAMTIIFRFESILAVVGLKYNCIANFK